MTETSASPRCGNCGEPLGEPEDGDPTTRKACPNCGSTFVTVPGSLGQIEFGATRGVQATGEVIQSHPRELMDLAQRLIVEGRCSIAVILVHTACEIAVGRS